MGLFVEGGFSHYATEQILYRDDPVPAPQVVAGRGAGGLLRPARGEDRGGIHLLYLRTTPSHVANIEKSFQLLGEDAVGTESPAIEGLQQESAAAIRRADDSVVDVVVVAAVVEIEHHEIGVYESLVTMADARGAAKVVRLLAQNLREEQAMLEKAKAIAKGIERDGMGFSV